MFLPISLDFNFESATDLFSLIPFIGMNNLKFGKKIVLDVGLYAPLLSVTLPPSTSTGVEWLPNANLDLTLKGPVNGTSNDKIRIFSLNLSNFHLTAFLLDWNGKDSQVNSGNAPTLPISNLVVHCLTCQNSSRISI